MRILTVLSFLFIISGAFGQQAPDFTVTDSDGVVHELYKDHLDKGQTVVIKLFFTTCPPCIQLAPWMEEKYQAWGAGQYDVEFIELSTQNFDSNADVANYKIQYGVTFPGVGFDGGGKDAGLIYKSGTFGPYYGTPTLAIIAPDGTVHMGFSYDDFDEVIASTGATGMDNGMDDPTSFSFNVDTKSNTSPEEIKYILKPANADFPTYDILEITGGSTTFEYPSDDFPEIENPVIIVEASGAAADGSMSGVDLLKIRKHILELDPFTEPYQFLAADVNSDDKISAVDLLNLTKAILELIDEFPNDTPSWKSIPAQIELTEDPGQIIELEFQLVKIGNVNG
ncbi:MAG: dockerin type I domain-containing protein [Saprospiraceae bacterium]|nr:dockerin type I domain-containing protein [Saprospiraceae bacterium]